MRRGPCFAAQLTPVTAVFIATVAWFVISLYVLPAYPETASVVTIGNGVLGLAIPMAILLGLVWGDLYAARSVGRIVLGAGGKLLTPVAVETIIADAIGDPTLTLGLCGRRSATAMSAPAAPRWSFRVTLWRAA